MSVDAGHRLFEHTADLGIEAWAPALAGLLAEAAHGLLETIYDRERVAGTERRAIAVLGDDEEDLVVRFLEELHFRFETERFAYREVARVAVDAAHRPLSAEAELDGEPFDAERHGYRCAVKAVTYHGLEVARTPEGLRARIILDI